MRPADLTRANRIRAELKSGAAREARIGAGVSGADVARAMRPAVSPQAVFWWETGRTVPTVEHALAYGRVLAALAKRAALGSRRGGPLYLRPRARCIFRSPSRRLRRPAGLHPWSICAGTGSGARPPRRWRSSGGSDMSARRPLCFPVPFLAMSRTVRHEPVSDKPVTRC